MSIKLARHKLGRKLKESFRLSEQRCSKTAFHNGNAGGKNQNVFFKIELAKLIPRIIQSYCLSYWSPGLGDPFCCCILGAEGNRSIFMPVGLVFCCVLTQAYFFHPCAFFMCEAVNDIPFKGWRSQLSLKLHNCAAMKEGIPTFPSFLKGTANPQVLQIFLTFPRLQTLHTDCRECHLGLI